MRLSAIVAIDTSGGIGINNKLPWRISEDMAFFRENTTGNKKNAIIMGRKTHESIGFFLSNRENIIMTKNKHYKSPIQKLSTNNINPVIFNEVEDCISYVNKKNFETAWVIGGEEIYKLFLPYIDEIYITHVLKEFQCDAFFPLNDIYRDFKLIDAKRQIVTENNTQKYCEIVFKHFIRQ
jgi:dihydrofolate reductase